MEIENHDRTGTDNKRKTKLLEDKELMPLPSTRRTTTMIENEKKKRRTGMEMTSVDKSIVSDLWNRSTSKYYNLQYRLQYTELKGKCYEFLARLRVQPRM